MKLDKDKKDRALREFRKEIGKPGYRGKFLAIYLKPIILQWLALEPQLSSYKVDSRPPHELVSLCEHIEHSLRREWRRNAAKTRRKKAEVRAKTAAKGRQGIFNFN